MTDVAMDSKPITGSKILVVDDEPSNVLLLEKLLAKEGYTNVVSTVNPVEGFDMIRREEPDLIMLDLQMPGMDGFAFMEKLHADMDGSMGFLPVLVLTADATSDIKRKALAAGANDFLTKPFDPVEVLLRARHLLETRRLNREIEQQNEHLEYLVSIRTAELEATRMEVIEKLALAAEYRDDDTKEHTRRVGQSAALMASSMGMPAHEVDVIRRASPLHDLGKIGIPDHILLKPGKLTAQEFEVIKTHSQIGADILGESSYELLVVAKDIAIAHHERFDGTGYPNGLMGEEIPQVARVVSVADVFDALTHERCYKPAWPVAEALTEIESQRGRQFDPEVVDVFLTLANQDRIIV